VLVLDDPLSALDVTTEARVEAALREVLASTTALIVAHRPSTVMLADRVALLEDGRITAVGTHSELLRTSDHYRFVITSLEEDERLVAIVDDSEPDPDLAIQRELLIVAEEAAETRAERATREEAAR